MDAVLNETLPARDLAATALRIAFGLVGPVLYLAPLGMSVLMPVLAALTLVAARRAAVLDWNAVLRCGWPFWALAGYAALSASWAIAPDRALFEAARLAVELAFAVALVAVAPGLPRRCREAVLAALAAGLMIVAPFVVIDALLAGELTFWARWRVITDVTIANSYSRGAIVHAVMLVPLALGLWRYGRPRLASASAALGLAPLVVLIAASAKLTFAVALAVAAITLWAPRFGRVPPIVLAAIIALLPLVFPWPSDGAVGCWLAEHKSSAVHRIHIWNFSTARIGERPLLGWGMDASRSMPGGNGEVRIYSCVDKDRLVGQGTVMSLHPHNAVLQLWLELGAVGAVGTALLVLWYGWRAATAAPDRLVAAAVAATWAASFTAGSVSFGIWQSWWISSLTVAFLISRLAAASAALDGAARSP